MDNKNYSDEDAELIMIFHKVDENKDPEIMTIEGFMIVLIGAMLFGFFVVSHFIRG